MDTPADQIQWASHLRDEGSQDMVDSPTPPGPDDIAESLHSDVDFKNSWQLISDETIRSSGSSSSFQHVSQMHVQQTGVSAALSALRSSKRVRMPWEEGPLAPIFKKDRTPSQFELRQPLVGLANTKISSSFFEAS